MKTLKFDNEIDWMSARRGKITGSRLAKVHTKVDISKDALIKELELQKVEFKKTDKKEILESLLSKGKIEELKGLAIKAAPKKIAFYELIAEGLGIPADDENDMVRGKRLEPEAIARFAEEAIKKVNTDLVLWTRDDDEKIAVSPDGFIGKTEAVEAKCLSSARHIQALIEQRIPDDYVDQIIQYFVVNDKLKTVYMVFYDPRIVAKPFFFLTIERESMKEEIADSLTFQKETLAEVRKFINELSSF